MTLIHAKSNTIGDMTGTVTVFNSAGTTTTAVATDLVRPADWNSAHNLLQTISGNTAGQSTYSGSNLIYGFSNGITGSINGNTLVFQGAKRTYSGMPLVPYGGFGLPFAQSSISLGLNSLYVFPFQLEDFLSMDHFRIPALVTCSSSASNSVQKGLTMGVGVYTRHATNDTLLTLLYSTTHTLAASHSSNASFAISGISAIGNSTSYSTFTSTSGGLNVSTILHGPREFVAPWQTVLAPGEYFFAMLCSTSGTAGNILGVSNLAVAYQTFNRPGQATNASNSGWHQMMLHGTYSTTTGAFPNSISATQIRQLGSMPILFAATGSV